MIDRLRAVQGAEERIAYALLFSSAARDEALSTSHIDVAIGLASGPRPSVEHLGALASRLKTTES